jgi:hypothetical protein
MKLEQIDDSNIFYTNIVFGKLQVEKIVIAEDDNDVRDVIGDNFQDFSFYHAISLKKLNNFLVQIKKNEDKYFAMVYEFTNYKDSFEVKEQVIFVDDLNKFKEDSIAKDKSIVILDDKFIEKAYVQIILMKNGEVKPFLSSKIEI